MNTPEFYILGPRIDNDLTFWNMDKGWVTDFGEGTPFTKEIMTLPLPVGSANIMAFSSASEPLAQYDLVPSGVGSGNFFHKSY